VPDHAARAALQLQKLQCLDRYSQGTFTGLRTLLQLPPTWKVHLLLNRVLTRAQT
jgi:hypothetical protein